MNQETEKLYYQKTYSRTFSAKVLSCEKRGDQFCVVLDRTLFYPEGGGQPADIGVLNTVNVLDVHEHGGCIVHTTDKPLSVGSAVTGGINWPHRFSLMQQHSGEHIVSGIVNRLFGLDNVGFHMGSKAVTVDFNGELGQNDILLVETLANEAVYRNVAIEVSYPDEKELAALRYRSKKELTGEVRIVTIPGFDVCACCGTHVAKTGEIGIIKLISAQRYKGGTRVGLLCGKKAVEDYNEKEASVGSVSVLLSAKPDQIQEAVEHLLEETNALRQKLISLKNQIFASKCEQVPEGSVNICMFEPDLEPADLRAFCLLLCDRCSGIAAVLSGDDATGYQYAMASVKEDVRTFGKELNHAFHGRGGGSRELVQGTVSGLRQEIMQFIENYNCGGI
ncbi:alanyl-tRNA editing protein [Caproiciproducens sp. AGMB10547]|uniref:Alanyl-tRNA editing protein n=2 Tax=Caproiciproducens faecalis TaxID=2820301 RepID=A0ABS7DRP0_9FIRM|nr:alanyl-tRNA editing protein [Caproiciproducens faecalis]